MQLLWFFLLNLLMSFPVISEDSDLSEVALPAVSVDEQNEDEGDNAEDASIASAEDSTRESIQPSNVVDAQQPVQEPQILSIASPVPAQAVSKQQVDEDDQPAVPVMHEVQPLENIPSPEDEEEGIDTVSLQDPAGNWLYKRIWWEKAEARYDKIKSSVNRILDNRMQFFEQRVNLDRSLFDPFYMSLGLTRGELQEAVSYLIEQLQGASSGGVAGEQKRSFMINTLQAEQQSVELLQNNVETISKIDHAIDDALTKLMNQINLCRNYEQEGWQYLRSIAQELSDKAARDHYYAMDTVWKNVKNVQQYIDGEFSVHFNELVSEAKKQTETITQTINQLKEKGIDLKKLVQNMLEQEDDVERDEDRDEDDEEEQASIGWFGWFINIFLWPYHKIIELWRSLFG